MVVAESRRPPSGPTIAPREFESQGGNWGQLSSRANLRELIVHSHTWTMHAELRQAIRVSLRGRVLPRTARVASRSVHATTLPTDFVTLTVGATSLARVRHALLQSDLVSAVEMQRWQRAPSRRPLAADRQRRATAARRAMPYDYATASHNASHWWRRGATGRGVRVAIFDTGLNAAHSFAGNVVEIVDFTDERTSEDRVGHSTFMTWTIASHSHLPRLRRDRRNLT